MAIRTTQLSGSGDVILDTLSNPTWLYGQDAIDQIIKMELSLWLGNWFKDLTRGVDWVGISKKNYNKNEIISMLISATLKNPYVTQVIDFSIKVDAVTRIAQINYSIMADKNIINGSVAI